MYKAILAIWVFWFALTQRIVSINHSIVHLKITVIHRQTEYACLETMYWVYFSDLPRLKWCQVLVQKQTSKQFEYFKIYIREKVFNRIFINWNRKIWFSLFLLKTYRRIFPVKYHVQIKKSNYYALKCKKESSSFFLAFILRAHHRASKYSDKSPRFSYRFSGTQNSTS